MKVDIKNILMVGDDLDFREPVEQAGEDQPRSEEEMQRIEQLVRTAVGFDQSRGDQVTVVNVPFTAPDAAGGVESANPLIDFDKNDIMRAAELGVLAIVALLIIFFVVRPLLKSAAGGGFRGPKRQPAAKSWSPMD